MAEYINGEAAVDAGYLSDWYISSVGDEPPVWTDAHIDELLNDFIVIPKDTKAADVQPIKHGRWVVDEHGYLRCDNCGEVCLRNDIGIYVKSWYCPECGADMRLRGDANG
jgi:rubredoxin